MSSAVRETRACRPGIPPPPIRTYSAPSHTCDLLPDPFCGKRGLSSSPPPNHIRTASCCGIPPRHGEPLVSEEHAEPEDDSASCIALANLSVLTKRCRWRQCSEAIHERACEATGGAARTQGGIIPTPDLWTKSATLQTMAPRTPDTPREADALSPTPFRTFRKDGLSRRRRMYGAVSPTVSPNPARRPYPGGDAERAHRYHPFGVRGCNHAT